MYSYAVLIIFMIIIILHMIVFIDYITMPSLKMVTISQFTWLAFVCLLLEAEGRKTPPPHPQLPVAAVRVNYTIRGLFEYHWAHDPGHPKIGFFFSCGQIGGWGAPDKWTQCGCNTPTACTDCFRWWDAVALESVATHGIYTGTRDNADIADNMLEHSPYNHKWNATAICTFIDDFTWYAIAYLRVYEWLKVHIVHSLV